MYVCSHALKLAKELSSKSALAFPAKEQRYLAALLLIICRDEPLDGDKSLWNRLGLPNSPKDYTDNESFRTEMYARSIGFVEFDTRHTEKQKITPDYTVNDCFKAPEPAIWYLAPGVHLRVINDVALNGACVLKMVSPPPIATTISLSVPLICAFDLIEPLIRIAEEGEIRSLNGWREKHYIPIGSHSQKEWKVFRHTLLDQLHLRTK